LVIEHSSTIPDCARPSRLARMAGGDFGSRIYGLAKPANEPFRLT
jgi:hypothetical protein